MVPEPQKITPPEIFSAPGFKIWGMIFIIAFICRVGFLYVGNPLPVMWDARLYVSASLGILGYFEHDAPYAEGEGGGEEYSDLYQKHLSGEYIDWLYYGAPTLPEAQKYIFYSGPVYPVIMAAIIAIPLPNDFHVIRVVNSLMDSLSVVFLAVIALIIWKRMWTVWLIVALQLLYAPLIFTCGILGLETITSFLLSGMFLLIALFYISENKWLMVSAGAVAGVLFLTKPTAALLGAPVFLFLLIVYLRQWKFLLRQYILFSIPFLFMVIPWIAFTSNHYGTLAMRDPDYSTANLRSSSSIDYEGYDLDTSDADFWTYPVFGRITENPLGYANLLSKKLIRLWWTPHDEFWQGPEWFEKLFHRLLIMLALLGIVVIPLSRNKLPLLALLIALYYTGIHVIFHSVPRYNFNALPGMFLLATMGIVFLKRKAPLLAEKKKQAMIMGALVIILFIINSDAFAIILPDLLSPNILVIIGATILLVFTGIRIKRLLHINYTSNPQQLFLWIPLIVLCLTTIPGWTRPWLQEWSYTIQDGKAAVGTKIPLRKSFQLSTQDEVFLCLDITTDPEYKTPVQVTMNGLVYNFVDGEPPADKQFYIKGSYNAFEKYMDFDKRSTRWYRKLKLKPETIAGLLGPNPVLTIEITIPDSLYTNQELTVYGFMQDISLENIYEIPSMRFTSVERFKEFGDRRIFETYQLESLNSDSYILGGQNQQKELLSARKRWGIFLEIKRPDLSRHYY